MSKSQHATVGPLEPRLYRGGCQCGAVHYEARIELAREGDRPSVWERSVVADSFRVLLGDESLAGYQFSDADVHHFFCVRCGVRVFSHNMIVDGRDFYTIDVRNLHARQTPSDGFRHVMLAALSHSS